MEVSNALAHLFMSTIPRTQSQSAQDSLSPRATAPVGWPVAGIECVSFDPLSCSPSDVELSAQMGPQWPRDRASSPQEALPQEASLVQESMQTRPPGSMPDASAPVCWLPASRGEDAGGTPPVASMDELARGVVARLASSFAQPIPGAPSCRSAVPVGLEIEVPWSSYFPDLWERFNLGERGIKGLSTEELEDLNQACAQQEATLLPRLRETVACGIPRGNDRYWEFALDPVREVGLLAQEVQLLTLAGLLPRNRRHSLHITLGNLRRDAHVYRLAMLLEMHCVDPARVMQGLAKTVSVVHSGWARKGEAGVFEKAGWELKHGSTVACELRMLQLPQTHEGLLAILATVAHASQGILDLQQGVDSAAASAWISTEAHLQAALNAQGLPDRRWGDWGVDHAVWERFAQALPALQAHVLS